MLNKEEKKESYVEEILMSSYNGKTTKTVGNLTLKNNPDSIWINGEVTLVALVEHFCTESSPLSHRGLSHSNNSISRHSA